MAASSSSLHLWRPPQWRYPPYHIAALTMQLPISIIYNSSNLVSTTPLQPPSLPQSPSSLPLGFSYRTYLLLLAVFFLKLTRYFGAGSIAVGALVNAAEAVAAPCSAAGTQPRPPRGCGTARATRPSTAPWQGGGLRPGPGWAEAERRLTATDPGAAVLPNERDHGDRRRDYPPALGRGLGGCRRHDPNGSWDRGR